MIVCPSCKGNGFWVGASLGVGECEDCGGDGHRLYGREGEKLEDIIEEAFKKKERVEVCDTSIHSGLAKALKEVKK